MTLDQHIEAILRDYRSIAVVGLSAKETRASFRATQYMQSQGYRIVPVNPRYRHILGETCYPDLASVPFQLEVVNLFQRSEHVAPFVDEAIRLGARAVWMQLDIVDEQAAARAQSAGLAVVMDRCMKIEHQRLYRDGRNPNGR